MKEFNGMSRVTQEKCKNCSPPPHHAWIALLTADNSVRDKVGDFIDFDFLTSNF